VKQRYRVKKRLFRKPVLVLQVAYRTFEPYSFDMVWAWRDAKIEDLTESNTND
jgi:hypothetical protein